MAMRIQASITSSSCSSSHIIYCSTALTSLFLLSSSRRQKSSPSIITFRRPFSEILFKAYPSSSSSSFALQARRGFSSQERQQQLQDFATPEDLYFQSPLKIVEYPDPLLRAKNKRINSFGHNLNKLVHEMFDIMYKTDGIGLSAPQVGINVQLMVFNPAGERGEGEEIVLVNPVVYKTSKKTLLYNEGCLSFPGIYADVERPASVKVDARDITGGRFKVNLSGLPARVFQHEFDHLQGILFFDRMSKDVLESIRSELKALEKKYEERTGQPTPERIDNYEGLKVAVGFART